jgi:hypothetical protein
MQGCVIINGRRTFLQSKIHNTQKELFLVSSLVVGRLYHLWHRTVARNRPVSTVIVRRMMHAGARDGCDALATESSLQQFDLSELMLARN